ncbi:MAG: GIY-YIG nuclease family protein [Candidatus Colwellbacteria bacterium]|nr:GIY-YIG nuclease family protein [Candidatus Colwellbacteria bacterium]
MTYYAYMARNMGGKLYVGVSQNPGNRVKEHNTQRGSAFTKSGNFVIVFKEEYSSLKEARRREIQIKKWRREKKEFLIERYSHGLPTKQ